MRIDDRRRKRSTIGPAAVVLSCAVFLHGFAQEKKTLPPSPCERKARNSGG